MIQKYKTILKLQPSVYFFLIPLFIHPDFFLIFTLNAHPPPVINVKSHASLLRNDNFSDKHLQAQKMTHNDRLPGSKVVMHEIGLIHENNSLYL